MTASGTEGRIKVAIVSRSDSTGGGASKVADTLRRLLLPSFENVDHWVSITKRGSTEEIKFIAGGVVTTFIWRVVAFVSRKTGYPDIFMPEWLWLRFVGFPDRYSLVHLHDTSKTLSPLTIKNIVNRVPVVWTLHDCSAFTAGCLFPIECTNFLETCHECGKLKLWPMETKVDRTDWIHQLKRKVFESLDIHLVAPSRWMADMADSSGMFQRRPVVIPNSVDLDVFGPCADKASRRESMGLPFDRFVVVVAAHALHDERKGFVYSLELLQSWGAGFHLVLLGSTDAALERKLKGISYTSTGYVNDQELVSAWYSIGDVFLFTSLGDNFPNVILESMASGLPVIGFAVGGAGEMIDHNENGWLAGSGDLIGLQQGLDSVYENRELLKSWSENARKKVEDNFTEELFKQRHIALYESILTPE